MPRRRITARSRRSGLDSPRTRVRLTSGHDFEFLDGDCLTDEELAEAWEDLGDDLMAEHIAQHPGSRPGGFWRFDAPEPRRQVADGPEAIGPADWFGKPHVFMGQPPSDMYESEAVYVERLGLWQPGERKALASATC
jgi:hypothetical protein